MIGASQLRIRGEPQTHGFVHRIYNQTYIIIGYELTVISNCHNLKGEGKIIVVSFYTYVRTPSSHRPDYHQLA